MSRTLIAIIGPTAIGKTATSLVLAKNIASEIISCDARQFYRELKIGACPPNRDSLKKIKHHFIGHLSIHQKYTAGDFQVDALKKLEKLFIRYSEVIMVGGSGLYERALTKGLDIFPRVPVEITKALHEILKKEGLRPLQIELERLDPFYYQQIDINNPHRIIRALSVIRSSDQIFSSFIKGLKIKRDFRIIKIGLHIPREQLYLQINRRVDKMLEQGFLEEAKKYHPYKHLNALQTVGYKELFAYLEGLNTMENTVEEIKKNTRRYAKRQLTWYRKDQQINWFSPGEDDKILAFIIKNLKERKNY